jgi:hypothetical protein
MMELKNKIENNNNLFKLKKLLNKDLELIVIIHSIFKENLHLFNNLIN